MRSVKHGWEQQSEAVGVFRQLRFGKATVRRIQTVASFTYRESVGQPPPERAAARICPVTSVADSVRTRGFVHDCFILTPPFSLLMYFHHAAQTS